MILIFISTNIRSSRISKESPKDVILLDAPVLEGKTVHKALNATITDYERSVERLSLLPVHDGLCLLRNTLAMPNPAYFTNIAISRQHSGVYI